MSGTDHPLRVPPRGGRPALDLGRDVHAVLGLVFDAMTLENAAAHLRLCAATGTSCFLSTPNVQFVVAASRDAAFRDSVLRSDLSIVDGAPILYLARLLGLPFSERVAGSDLFDRLRRADTDRPIKVFFFGGEDGVAERAAAALNAEGGGMTCVGFTSPGFGSVEAMSSDLLIDQINASGADFVVLSIGVKKGQAWILRNRDRLHAPLVSYLGAVVNFVAGHVKRTPSWMRRTGLEWMWRITQEPVLWRRYASDAWALLRMLMAVLPGLVAVRLASATPTEPGDLRSRTDGETTLLSLTGNWTSADLPRLRRALVDALYEGGNVQLELSALQDADAALFALIGLIDRWQVAPRVVAPASRLSSRVSARFRGVGLEYLIDHLEPAGRSA